MLRDRQTLQPGALPILAACGDLGKHLNDSSSGAGAVKEVTRSSIAASPCLQFSAGPIDQNRALDRMNSLATGVELPPASGSAEERLQTARKVGFPGFFAGLERRDIERLLRTGLLWES